MLLYDFFANDERSEYFRVHFEDCHLLSFSCDTCRSPATYQQDNAYKHPGPTDWCR